MLYHTHNRSFIWFSKVVYRKVEILWRSDFVIISVCWVETHLTVAVYLIYYFHFNCLVVNNVLIPFNIRQMSLNIPSYVYQKILMITFIILCSTVWRLPWFGLAIKFAKKFWRVYPHLNFACQVQALIPLFDILYYEI